MQGANNFNDKPANSHPGNESRVFDFVGMLGLPLVPCHEFPTKAPCAFFPIHAMKDPAFAAKLARFVQSGKPVLILDSLAQALKDKLSLNSSNVHVLAVKGDPKSPLLMGEDQLNTLRKELLAPFSVSFAAPNKVALHIFNDKSWVVEDFNDSPVVAQLGGRRVAVDARSWKSQWN